MTTLGWIVFAILLLGVAASLVLVLQQQRQIRTLEDRLAELSAVVVGLEARADSFAPLLADTRSALRKSQNERLRADDLISAASSLTGAVDSATRLAVSIVSSPIVRVLSISRGVRRGVQRLTKRSRRGLRAGSKPVEDRGPFLTVGDRPGRRESMSNKKRRALPSSGRRRR